MLDFVYRRRKRLREHMLGYFPSIFRALSALVGIGSDHWFRSTVGDSSAERTVASCRIRGFLSIA